MEGGAQRYWDPVVSHSQSHSSDTYISSLCSSRNSSIPTGSTHAPDAGMIFQEKIRLLKQTMEQQRLQRQREFNEQQQKRHQQQQQELLRRQTEMRSPSVSSRAGSRTVRGPVASLSFSPSPPPSWRRLTGDALAENNTDCSHHSNGSSPELVVVEASPVRKDTTASPLRCDASTMTESILEERTNRVTSKKKNAKEASLDRATVVSPAVVASGSARDDSPAATEMCEKGAERPAPPRRQVPKQSKGIRTLRAPSESSASVHSVQSMPGPTHRRMPSSDADVLYTDRAARNASLPQRCAGVCASPAQDMERPVKLFRASALDASAEQRRRCLHRQMRLVDAAMSRVEEMSWLKSLRAGTTPRAAAAAERARLAALRRRYEAELKRVEGGTDTGTGTDTCTGTGTARPPVRVASVVRQASRGRPRAGSTNCAREETRRTLRYGPTAYEYVIDSPQQWRTRHPLAQKTHAPQMRSNAMGYAPQMGSNAMGYAPQMESNAMGHAPQMGSNAMGHAPQMGSNAMGHAPQMESNAKGYAPQMGSNAKGRAPRTGSNTRVQRSRSVSLDAERMAALYARHTSERRDAPLYWRVAHTNLCADVPAGQYYCTEVGENNADSEKAKAEPSRVSAPFSSSSSSSRALCYSLRAPSRSGEVERKPQPTLCFRMETSPHCNPRLSPPERSVCRADSAAQRTPRALSLQSSEVRVSPLTEGSPFKASPSIQRVVQGPTAVQGMSRALGDDRTNELRRVSDVCASVSPSKRRVESGGVSLRQLFGHNGTVAISPPSASKVCSSTDVLIERIQQMRMLMK